MEPEKKPLGHEFNFGALICECPIAKGHGQKFHTVGNEDKPFLNVQALHSSAQCAYYRDASNNHHVAVFRLDEPLEKPWYTDACKNREPDRGLGYLLYHRQIKATTEFFTDDERTKGLLTVYFPEGDLPEPTHMREVTASFYQDKDLRLSMVLTYATFLKRTDKGLLEDILGELKAVRKILEESPTV